MARPTESRTSGRALPWLAGFYAAIVALCASGLIASLLLARHVGPQERWEPFALGALSVLAFGAVLLLLVPTRRLLLRELDERRHAERVLRESEDVFRQLAENIREVFYLCEWPAGGLIFVSPGVSRMWGRPPGRAFSFRSEWLDAIVAEDRERVRAAWERVTVDGHFDVEYRVRRADGEERWIHDRAFPVRDERSRAFRIAGIAEDITERTRGERRFRDLVESAPDAMVIVDREGRIVLVNAQAERLFGHPRQAMVGASVEMLLPERYRSAHRELRAHYQKSPRLRPMGAGSDLYAQSADAGEFPVEISLSPLETFEGPVVSAAIRDISETRAAQRELALQRDALARVNADLARSNAELDQFAAVASHDLQEPLRKLVSFAELLREDLDGDLPERAAEDLAFIVDAAERMRKLVADLLTLSRTGTNAMRLRPEPLDACVDRVLETLELRVAETRAEITRDPLPVVTGDRMLLEALYQNLIANALKFTPDDTAPQVHLSAEPDGNGGWVLGVRDRGIGIDPDYAAEIFQPFRRLHTRQAYPGTGIGLAIARKSVDRHGGRIWVETPAGGGAHFRFVLGAATASTHTSEETT